MTELPARPSLVGRRTQLRLVQPSDFDWLYPFSLGEENGFRWRYRGTTPSPEQFNQQMWGQAHCQFVLTERASGKPVGLLQSYGLDELHQYAKVALLLSPETQKLGWPLEGALIFLRHLFHHWPLRKVYIEGPAENVDALATGINTLYVEEGRLRQHEYFDGRLTDWVTLAIYREEFDRQWEEKIAWFVGQGHEPQTATDLRNEISAQPIDE